MSSNVALTAPAAALSPLQATNQARASDGGKQALLAGALAAVAPIGGVVDVPAAPAPVAPPATGGISVGDGLDRVSGGCGGSGTKRPRDPPVSVPELFGRRERIYARLRAIKVPEPSHTLARLATAQGLQGVDQAYVRRWKEDLLAPQEAATMDEIAERFLAEQEAEAAAQREGSGRKARAGGTTPGSPWGGNGGGSCVGGSMAAANVAAAVAAAAAPAPSLGLHQPPRAADLLHAAALAVEVTAPVAAPNDGHRAAGAGASAGTRAEASASASSSAAGGAAVHPSGGPADLRPIMMGTVKRKAGGDPQQLEARGVWALTRDDPRRAPFFYDMTAPPPRPLTMPQLPLSSAAAAAAPRPVVGGVEGSVISGLLPARPSDLVRVISTAAGARTRAEAVGAHHHQQRTLTPHHAHTTCLRAVRHVHRDGLLHGEGRAVAGYAA
jgi:hypothetical protein